MSSHEKNQEDNYHKGHGYTSCPACGSVATHPYNGAVWCAVCGEHFEDQHLGVYTPPTSIDMATLYLVAEIEKPCRVLRINFEDWGLMDFPVWCGLTKISPCDDIEPNSIQAVRGA